MMRTNMQSASTSKSTRGPGKLAGLLISIGVSGLIIGYLIVKLDWAQVGGHLQKVHLGYMPVIVVLLFAMIGVRWLRWKYLHPKGKPLSFLRLFEATAIGYFASFVLPLRAGEIIRPWALSRLQPVPFPSALASIFTERVADALCLLSLFLLCLLQIDSMPPVIITGARILALLTLLLAGFIALSYMYPGKFEGMLHLMINAATSSRRPALAKRLNLVVTEYFMGLRSIRSVGDLFFVILWSYGLWCIVAFLYYIILLAFGEKPDLWAGMILNVFIALAVAAPSAPGFIGTFQAGCIIALSTIYDYSTEFAMAYSVVAHTIQFVFIIALGLTILHVRGLKLSNLKRASLPDTADTSRDTPH